MNQKVSQEPITLYLDYLSQPSRAVLAFCLFNKIPHKIEEVHILQGQHLKPRFSKINPLKKVPAINDKGFVLQESHAILRYLADSKDVPTQWYPKEPRRRALVDRYLDWHHTNTRRCSRYFAAAFRDVFPPRWITWTVKDEEEPLTNALKTLEEVFLGYGEYINGEEDMTIADISAVCEIIQLKSTDFDFERFPKLQQWIDRCMEHPEMKEAYRFMFKAMNDSKL